MFCSKRVAPIKEPTMKAPLSVSLIAYVCVSLSPNGVAAQINSPKLKTSHALLQVTVKNEEVIARLERSIPQLMAAGDVPGLSIALIRDAELVWHKGFGVRNTATKSPVNDDTVFEAASLGKPVFAYAVLKLVDSGNLDLDTPLTKYLPGSYDVGDDTRLNRITARHVLSHTTGFPNWRPRGDTVLKIHFTPGERFSYSGEGYVYLSKVVTHLTGEKFDAFMTRMVFDPLGMTSSSYIWQDGYDALKIFNHNLLGEPTRQNKVTEAKAASSLNTTARDYGGLRGRSPQRTGLKKETARLMLTPQVRVGRGRDTTNRPAGQPSPYISWGLGWGTVFHYGTGATMATTNPMLSRWTSRRWGLWSSPTALTVSP
jgi:CubicO group peptidase (beta-lactamase class C family)